MWHKTAEPGKKETINTDCKKFFLMTKTLLIYVFREQVQFQEVLQIHY